MKGKPFIAAALIFILAAGFTAASLKNYVEGLNRVVISSTAPNRIRASLTADAVLHFSDIRRTWLPEGCRVEEIYAHTGDQVQKGDPLLRLEEEGLREACYAAIAKARPLQSGQGNPAADLLAEIQAGRLARQAEIISGMLENGGIVTSEAAGQLMGMHFRVGEEIPAGAAVEIGLMDGCCTFEWTVSPENYRPFTDFLVQVQEGPLPIKTRAPVYDENRRAYQYISEPVALAELSSPQDGSYAQVTMRYVSGEYPAVLPRGSIQRDADGAAYVYLLAERSAAFGTERYLMKTGVTILDQDDFHAAVLSPLENLAIHSTRPMQDLEPVLVLEPQSAFPK